MKCSLCKNGDMMPGKVTLTLERDTTTLVIKNVPAKVCNQCGDESFSENVTNHVLEMMNDAVRRGVQVEVLSFTEFSALQPV